MNSYPICLYFKSLCKYHKFVLDSTPGFYGVITLYPTGIFVFFVFRR